ncbi:MAG: hypothetical protein H8E37_02075 [Planctomycetes bacterium]|nr:hypothetical protein [Planctomycetota bacterium]
MKTSLESSSLYMLLAAVPLLPTMDDGLANPAVFLTTAWCLAAAFGGWLLVRRRKESTVQRQHAH